MSPMSCPQEAAVDRAVRSGEWREQLQSHAASCPVCREVVPAARWMQNLAHVSGADARLPDASAVWCRAQLSEMLCEEQAEIEHAHKLIEAIQAASLALVSIGLLCWAIWNWRTLDSAALWFSPQAWAATFAVLASMPLVFWSAVGVLSFIALAFAYPIFAAD
jgi:hypothetical protein